VLSDFAVSYLGKTASTPKKDQKTMNTIRCFLLGAIVVISSSMLALGGEMQVPGRSDPAATPTPAALTSASPTNAPTKPTSSEEIQIEWQDATTMLMEILLTIF
jgi:hypothetical protein